MKKHTLVLVLLAVILGIAGVVYAGESKSSGWAWGTNLGSFSFSSDNPTAGGGNYSVRVATSSMDAQTARFVGHAWSSNLGWLSFEQSDIANCPVDEADTAEDAVALETGWTKCTPRIDFTTGKVNGWARLLTLKNYDSTTGWVHLSGTNHLSVLADGVKYTNGTLRGYAWSGDHGWISLNAFAAGGNDVRICSGSTCPTAGINFNCHVNGVAGNGGSPILPIERYATIQATNVTGGGGPSTYRYTFHSDQNAPADVTDSLSSSYQHDYNGADAGEQFIPKIIVSDGQKSATRTCGTVAIESVEPVASDVKLWIGGNPPDGTDCLTTSPEPSICKKTFDSHAASKDVKISWDSSNTLSCTGKVLSKPAASTYDFDSHGWDDFSDIGTQGTATFDVDQIGSYQFGIQCVKDDGNGTLIPATYTSFGYQNKVRVQITTSDGSER